MVLIEVMKVQFMARWSSPVVTHYTRLAPLRAITTDFKRNLAQRQTETNDMNEKIDVSRSFNQLALQLPRAPRVDVEGHHFLIGTCHDGRHLSRWRQSHVRGCGRASATRLSLAGLLALLVTCMYTLSKNPCLTS